MRSDVCDAAGAVERLWQNGEVPVWIDISVDRADDRFTYLRLGHTSRMSGRDEALTIPGGWVSTISVPGPRIAPRMQDLERTGRFDLHWPRRPSLG